jgi:molybdopterin adenylyltransferase
MKPSMRVAILTVSDSSARGERDDLSGPALCERCREVGWVVAAQAIVADDANAISKQIASWADTHAASLILTTGGTGIAPRDITPEATRAVLEREIPGLGELMRAEGLNQTKFAALSRALAGTRAQSLIVNLPGSPRGAVHSFEIIRELVPHIIDLLEGRTKH